jgi:hypothetical protein
MKDIFNKIYERNIWGSMESVSGTGSSITQTKTIIRKLPALIEDFNIKTMIDAPCGDFNWMRFICNKLDLYIGIDIVEDIIKENKSKYQAEQIQFYSMDLTRDSLPVGDLILCRDCLVHFSYSDILLALNNFKASGAKYLLTTTFPSVKRNFDIKTGEWRPLNLEIEPFYFPKPLIYINENCTEVNKKFRDKSLALWRINDLTWRKEKIFKRE